MAAVWKQLRQAVEQRGRAALVGVIRCEGSAPCEPGARIVAHAGGFLGTIGGGRLEYEALADAHAMLAEGARAARFREWPLGPGLGQCCGGMVTTLTEVFDASDLPAVATLEQAEAAGPFDTFGIVDGDGRIARRIEAAPLVGRIGPAKLLHAPLQEHFGNDQTPVLLFGAGHVGRALVLAMAPLPFRIRWIDSRPDQLPPLVPENVRLVLSDQPEAEIAAGPSGAFVLILTHSHPLDYAIAAAALRRPDLGYVGLIGSATKRARFARLARQMGLTGSDIDRLICPIGIPGIVGKEPAVIAASCVAQLLMRRQDVSAEHTFVPREQDEAGLEASCSRSR
jgi:xanthine dehydrogenase accessory factor